MSALDTFHTKGHVDKFALSLLEAGHDGNNNVRSSVESSMLSIGSKQPLMILARATQFLHKNAKNKTHRVFILRVMAAILDRNRPELPKELSEALVNLSVKEMTGDKSINSEWQDAACELNTRIAALDPESVATALLNRFPQSSSLPHYFVLKALADFANQEPIAFVPFLPDIMARVLPVLSVIKHDNFRWVFSACLGRFAQALLQYAAAQGTMHASEFAGGMHAAMSHMLNEWIGNRQRRVRLAAAESIGYIAQIVDAEQLAPLIPRMVQSYTTLLRKEKGENQLAVASGMAGFLSGACRTDAAQSLTDALHPHVEAPILTSILAVGQPCFFAPPDRPVDMKIGNELLRALETITASFTDDAITFVRRTLEAKDIASRRAAVAMLRHLVNRADLTEHQDTVLSATTSVAFTESDMAWRKSFAQLVIAMAGKGFLLRQGGQDLVKFVVDCAAVDGTASDDAADLQNIADHVLSLMVSTLPEMDDVLYPYMLEFLCSVSHIRAFAILTRCVAELAMRKRSNHDESFYVDFDVEVNVPKPPELFARLLAMLCHPYARNRQGKNVLRCLYALAPLIHASLHEAWEPLLPELKEYLDDQDEFDTEEWHSKVRQLLSDGMDAIDDDEWAVSVGEAVVKHMTATTEDPANTGTAAGSNKDNAAALPTAGPYNTVPSLKQGALTLLGAAIRHAKLKNFVSNTIHTLFTAAIHTVPEHRSGAALGLGLAAAAHTDIVLDYLKPLAKPVDKKKFSLFGKRSTGPSPEEKATVMLAYGYVSMLAPKRVTASRVQARIAEDVHQLITSSAGPLPHDLQHAALRATELLATAVNPERLGEDTPQLRSRHGLTTAVLSCMLPDMKKKKRDINLAELRPTGLAALRQLVLLPPHPMPPEMEREVLDGCLALIGEQRLPDTDAQEAVEDGVQSVLGAVLSSEPSVVCLQRLMDAIAGRTHSPDPQERIAATQATVYVLKQFGQIASELEEMNPGRDHDDDDDDDPMEENDPDMDQDGEGKGKEKDKESKNRGITGLGRMVGMLVPRVTETMVTVRESAVETIYLIFRIHAFLSTGSADVPEHVQRLAPLRDSLNTHQSADLFRIAKELALILSHGLSTTADIHAAVEQVLHGVKDVDMDGANGACVALRVMLRKRGEELSHRMLDGVLDTAPAIADRRRTLDGLLAAGCAIGRHHPTDCFHVLLERAVPHPYPVRRACETFAADRVLRPLFLDFLMDTISNTQLYEEHNGKHLPTHNPRSATVCLAEFMGTNDARSLVQHHHAAILVTLLLRVGSAQAADKPPPLSEVQDALRAYGRSVGVDLPSEAMEQLGSRELYPRGIISLVDRVCAQLKDASNNDGDGDEHLEDKHSRNDDDNDSEISTTHHRSEEEDNDNVDNDNNDNNDDNDNDTDNNNNNNNNDDDDTPASRKHEKNNTVAAIYDAVSPFLSRMYLGQRMAATAIMASLLPHVRHDRELVAGMVNGLLSRSSTTEGTELKMLAIEGLGNLSHLSAMELGPYITPVAGALLACYDKQDTEVVVAATRSLERVFRAAAPADTSAMLLNVCVRIRPFLDDGTPAVRSAAMRLLAVLGQARASHTEQVLHDQAHVFFPTLILHLADDVSDVRAACYDALTSLVPAIGHESLTELFPVQDNDDTNNNVRIDQDDLFPKLAAVWVNDFPGRVNELLMEIATTFRTHTQWPSMIAAGVVLLGHILASLPSDAHRKVNMEQYTSSLISLLKDKNAEIRKRSAEMMGILYAM